MKNILLLIFLFLTITAFAQNNEVIISYQPFQYDTYGKGVALSYYRAVAPRQSMGLRTNFNQTQIEYSTARFRSGSIDAVSRWNLSKGNKFRLMVESGVSILRTYEEVFTYEELYQTLENCFYFCGVLSSREELAYKTDDNWYKTTRFGIASAVSIDFQVFKRMIIGASYGYNIYLSNNDEPFYEKRTKRSNLNINLGYKF
ncbi:MAG: opacity protein-like surface antigen [Saprospiraceae bacterium]|jgi:opacity protein-like surface antigen